MIYNNKKTDQIYNYLADISEHKLGHFAVVVNAFDYFTTLIKIEIVSKTIMFSVSLTFHSIHSFFLPHPLKIRSKIPPIDE